MATELFRNDQHRVIVFNDLVRGDDGVQANQMLILHGDQSMLLDPGGALLYTPLSMAVARYIPLKQLTYIFASHQDPDVIGSADRWLTYTHAKIICSKLWGRFVPHSVPHYMETGKDRYILLPDEGAELVMGDSAVKCLPAHFLHSVGNFNVYDPISRILFSGDVGSSMVTDEPYTPVQDFRSHLPKMEGFHRRYMASNKACRTWVHMVRHLDVDMIVPQHGLPMQGPQVIGAFLDWMDELRCGVDLMTAPGKFTTNVASSVIRPLPAD